MRHVLSTHVLVQHRLTTATLERIREAGIGAIEIFCGRPHLDWSDKAQINEFGYWFRDCDLKVHSVHAPIYTDDVWGRSGPHAVINITEASKPLRIKMVDEIKRAIEIAEQVPFRYLIQHLGVSGQEWSEGNVESAFRAMEDLSLFAKNRGVEILIENIPNRLSSAERLLSFVEMTRLELGFCFDTGHAHIMEGLEESWRLMKTRVRSTHVHDNDGKADLHLVPLLAGGGTIDWKRAMALLREREADVPLVLELKASPEFPHAIDTAKESFDRLENL